MLDDLDSIAKHGHNTRSFNLLLHRYSPRVNIMRNQFLKNKISHPMSYFNCVGHRLDLICIIPFTWNSSKHSRAARFAMSSTYLDAVKTSPGEV
jgi:hypothetical protein